MALSNATLPFLRDLHIQYIVSLNERKDELEYWLTEHLRLNGLYWGLTALHLLGAEDALDREEVIAFVLSCQNEDGGFGGNAQHDSQLHYTLSALQVLHIQNAIDRIDKNIVRQHRADGSFQGDEWGEYDTRFSYCGLSALSLLGSLDAVDVNMSVDFIMQCRNFDGGFGMVPGAESHAAQGALAIVNQLDKLDHPDQLAWWLSERQLPCGGLNGRPDKLEDVCYSWWVLSSLRILGRVDWINKDALTVFILSAQDNEAGGIADRKEHMGDVFHTLFGIAGLSMLGYNGLEAVDPVYCMPKKLIVNLGLNKWEKSHKDN